MIKKILTTLALAVTMTSCSQMATANTPTLEPVATTYIPSKLTSLEADIELIVGEVDSIDEYIQEGEAACRYLSTYAHNEDQVLEYLGAFALTHTQWGTPRNVGRTLAHLMTYSCPATALKIVEMMD